MAGYPWGGGGGMYPNPYMQGIVSANAFNPQQALDALAQQYQTLRQQVEQHQAMIGQQTAAPQMPPPQRTSSGFTVRAAANIEEVRATPIEPMSTNVFVNLAQGEVYISKIGDNGLKDIQTYSTPVVASQPESAEEKLEPELIAKFPSLSEIDMRFEKLEKTFNDGLKKNSSDEIYSRLDKLESLITKMATQDKAQALANEEVNTRFDKLESMMGGVINATKSKPTPKRPSTGCESASDALSANADASEESGS